MMAGFESLQPFAPPEAYQDRQAPVRTSTFFPATDFVGRPVQPRKWLVEDLVPKGTVTLFSGDGGVGKSLLALQMAVAAAVGKPWLGRHVEGSGALFLSAEDDQDELHRRLRDVALAEGIEFAEMDRLTVRSLAGEDALLCHPDRSGVLRPSDLFDELDQRIGEDKPALVVLDTLADLNPASENDRALVRQFVGLLRGLAIRHQTAVLLLSHPSLTGLSSGTGTSGSTAWNNSVRSRLYLERVVQDGYEPDPDARLLTVKKANYGRIGAEVAVRWTGGVFVAPQTESGLDRTCAGMKAERVFLKLLRELTEQGRRVNHAGGQTYAPNVFASHPESEGVTKRAFKAAMETLLAGGQIRAQEEGPPSRRRQFIEVAGKNVLVRTGAWRS